MLDGAAVRISIVGFDGGDERSRHLNGSPVETINADLSGMADVTGARPLPENRGVAFTGIKKTGKFDIPAEVATALLASPNPDGRSNSDVVRPAANGLDVTRRPRGTWIIDFGVHLPEVQAALYEVPYEHVRRHVLPERARNRDPRLQRLWWLHERPRPEMRAAVVDLRRFVVTPVVARHRLFAWLDPAVLPDHQLVVFARDDDYFFGVLQSKLHDLWSLSLCTWMGVGNDPRYTPSTIFETFPFPWPLGSEPAGDPQVEAIATAARRLVELRDGWLNPPGWADAELRKRTLTNLYNQRPAWLDQAHCALDRAVLDAYGWPHDLGDDDLLARLLALNMKRAR